MSNDVSFERAPLIEIIAELRWLPVGAPPLLPGQVQLNLGGYDSDGFLMAFGRRPEIARFTNAEKLVPPGFPSVWHQVVWRYRDPTTPAALLQVGPGIFSAHALQPYRRWSEFRPTVSKGVASLLASRSSEEHSQPLTSLSLRYINAFTYEITDGMTPRAFARDVLKFKVDLPSALKKLCALNVAPSIGINLLIPVANTTKTMTVQVGDGNVRFPGAASDAPVVMLDMTVSETTPTMPNIEDILTTFDRSRDVIHNAFLQMTASIQAKMGPRKEGANVTH